jgi:aspartate dehydrogenase
MPSVPGASLGLGIVGAGCIGRRVAQAVADGTLPYRLAAVHDIDAGAADRLIHDYAPGAVAGDLAAVLSSSDVVLESAAGSAVPGLVSKAQLSFASCGRPAHVLVMSVGGLLDVALEHGDGPVIHVPSGALGGLDAVQALAVAGLDEVVLTTRKPPAGLGEAVGEATVLFEGPAREVIAKYPRNVNVAMALSLAGLGPDDTRVRLIADPAVDRNTHHVFARGPAGEVEFESRNVPFPENPRTSYLAALSAIALLRRLVGRLQVG